MHKNRTTAANKRILTIGIYAPSLQGLYIGEIVNQLRQLCFIKGYKLILVRTGNFGGFDSDIHLQQIDAAIIIRNAVAPELLERMRAMDVPCVAIAYDYFPQKVPLVGLDNEFGVRLAFDHLLARGCRRIAFVGDLSQYDLRKRYEAYGSLCDEHGLELGEAYLFLVDDSVFSGGQAAAQQFIERNCDADAVIFGASLTAIGFAQHFDKASIAADAKPCFVCFDANPLVPVLTPTMLVIDQNLSIMAYRALNVLEAQLDHQPFSEQTLVQPKLLTELTAPANQADDVLATCADVSALRSTPYVKALLANCYEWPAQIGFSNLDQLMVLAPVFSGFMQAAFLLRHFVDDHSVQWLKHAKSFTTTGPLTNYVHDRASLGRAFDGTPATALSEVSADCDFNLNMPIRVGDKVWGWLVVYGKTPKSDTPSSYFAFAGFLETAVKFFEQQLSLAQLKHSATARMKLDAAADLPHVDPLATIEWTIASGVTLWSERALKTLGFVSPVECNIYQNMELTDRVHKEDLEVVRQAVAACCSQAAEVRVSVRFKLRSGDYAAVALQGKAVVEANKTVAIIFCLGVESESNS